MTVAQALIFDLDGVLTDTVEHHYRSWLELAGELGLAFDRKANEALRGRSRTEALELFLRGSGLEGERTNREELLRRKNAYFLESVEDLGPNDLNPGVAGLLQKASSRGVRMALASSSRNARLVAQRLGILQTFEVVADGCSGLRPKPAPDLFLWVAGALQLPPSACTVVEDAEAGVEAGLAGGFRVVGLGPPERVGAAHLRLADLAGATPELLLGEGGA